MKKAIRVKQRDRDGKLIWLLSFPRTPEGNEKAIAALRKRSETHGHLGPLDPMLLLSDSPVAIGFS